MQRIIKLTAYRARNMDNLKVANLCAAARVVGLAEFNGGTGSTYAQTHISQRTRPAGLTTLMPRPLSGEKVAAIP